MRSTLHCTVVGQDFLTTGWCLSRLISSMLILDAGLTVSVEISERIDDLSQHACLRMRRSNGSIAPWSFVDGNKRIAFAAGIVFLQLNGYLVKSRKREFGERIVAVLERSTSEADPLETFADWIRANLQPL